MTDSTDIVDDIFSRVRKILGEDFNGEIAVRLQSEESAIRHEWGGQKQYVQKIAKGRRRILKEAAVDDVKNGVPVSEVIRSRGISRTEIYRILKTK